MAERLVRERGVAVAQAARDLGVHENVQHKRVMKFAADPAHAFPAHGQCGIGNPALSRLVPQPSRHRIHIPPGEAQANYDAAS